MRYSKPNDAFASCLTADYLVDSLHRTTQAADELAGVLRDLLTTSKENMHHAQELQKRGHDKGIEPGSYACGDNIFS